MNISYLISRYPAVSHTFIYREIKVLRELGFSLNVASINSPDRPLADLTPGERNEAGRTFYVKRAGWKGALSTHLHAMATMPFGYFKGMFFALRLGMESLPKLMLCLLYFTEAVMIGAWMKRNRSTHLHVHFATQAATVGLILSRTFPFTFSLTVHGPDEFYEVSLHHLTEKVERAAFICVIGLYARSQLMRLSRPECWPKILVSPLGVDAADFAPAARVSPNRRLTIVCVGRLVPAKGQTILLLAVRELLSRGRDIEVHFAGDGPDRANLETLAGAPEFRQRVVFTGPLTTTEVRILLAKTDIFVLPSFAEGIPVALMEAMSMEIPCVSTCITGIPELIDSGVNGLLTAPSDVTALADALDRLALDPSLRAALGRKARERVQNGYALKKNVERLGAIFKQWIPSSVNDWPAVAGGGDGAAEPAEAEAASEAVLHR